MYDCLKIVIFLIYLKIKYSIAKKIYLLKLIDETRFYFPESYIGFSIVSKFYNTKSKIYIKDTQKKKLIPKVFILDDSDLIYRGK